MSTEYRLDVYNAAGTMLARLVGSAYRDTTKGGFLELSSVKRVNEPGLVAFTLDGDSPLVTTMDHKSRVEVWRRDVDRGIAWYMENSGLFLDQERRYTDHALFRAVCYGPLWLLSTRYILYYANTADRSKFTTEKAETIMKTLVDYNAGANATVGNGRMRTPNTIAVTVAADTAAGNTLDWYCAWDNLLRSLQALVAAGAGGDFDLVRSGANWEFRWYTGQLGTDRSATVTFALDLGNMRDPVYRRTRSTEVTVALVGGQGEESARATRTVTGTDYGASNDIEVFVNATNASSDAGYDAEGARWLKERQAEHELAFDVVQDGPYLYGRDYFLGDLVTATYDAISVTRKVIGAQIDYNKDGTESVKIDAGAV